MASLMAMEWLRQSLRDKGLETEPDWIKGYETRTMHLSGELREAAMNWSNLPPEIEALLDEAAECLDDAHTEWMQAQLEQWRKQHGR